MNKRSVLFLAVCLLSIIIVSSFLLHEVGFLRPDTYSGGSWQRPIEHFATTLAVDDGKVFVVDETEGNVNCFDSQNGKSIWNYSLNTWRSGGIVISENKVYVGFPERKVACLDENTGKLQWTFENTQAPNQLYDASPNIIVKDGKIFAITDTVSVHNATSGELLWEAIKNWSSTGGSWSMSAYPLGGDPFDGNYVYATGGDLPNLNFFKLNIDNGQVIWKSSVMWDATMLTWGLDVLPSVLAITQGKVIIGSILSNNPVLCLDSNTGEKLWSIDVNATIYNPTVYNNLLFFAATNGYIYAVKLADGTVAWKTKVDTQNLFAFNSAYDSTLQTSPIRIDSQNQRLFWSLVVKQSSPSSNYTGILCSLDLSKGNVNWIKHLENEGANFGGDVGLAFNNDTDKLFLTKNSGLWIFNASSSDLIQSQQFNHYVLPPIALGNQTFVTADLWLSAYTQPC